MGIYLGSGLLAILLIFIFLDKIELEGEAKSEGTCTLFISTLTFLRNRKMQLLIPITIFSGLEQGFVFGDFSKVRQKFLSLKYLYNYRDFGKCYTENYENES